MRPEPKKRIDTNAAESRRPMLNAAFSGLDLPHLPAAAEAESVSPGKSGPPAAPERLWKMGRVVLRRETARRGGKTVIVVHDFATHLPLSIIESVAKKIRAACGCGGAVKDRTIEIQGDQPARIRAQGKDPKKFHEHPRDAGPRQNGVVLLIVINHKEPQEQQTAQDAAGDLSRRMRCPKGPDQRDGKKKRRGKDAPPTLESEVFCVGSGGEDQCLAGSHAFRAEGTSARAGVLSMPTC